MPLAFLGGRDITGWRVKMSEVLVLEFEGFGRNVYDAVNRELGMNDDWSAGEIPAGLIDHVAGASAAGWVVVEVWESREAQAAFMDNRLGAALQAGGVTGPPSRTEWLSDPSHHLVG
jgi:hypothetical protein